ncbi:MAG: redoxin domain-containing protein [Chloroflexi bacterium]|nr:redoxin domain-containing protein [Chloroflexota bacterium]
MGHPRSGLVLVALLLILAPFLGGCRAPSRGSPVATNRAASGANPIPSATLRVPGEPTAQPTILASPTAETTAPTVERGVTATPPRAAETSLPPRTVMGPASTPSHAALTRSMANRMIVQPSSSATATRALTTSGGQAGPRVGQPAPDFSLAGLDGKTVRLRDFRGQPVVLNFFATWCGPCQEELPAFQATYQKYHAQGLQILLVDLKESPQDVQSFATKLGLSVPIVVDQRGTVSQGYALTILPTTYFIDATGVIRGVQVGPLTEATLMDTVAALVTGSNGAIRSSEAIPAGCCPIP